MQANRSSYFNFFFSKCLLSLLLSITNLAMRSFNFLLPLLRDKFTSAIVGIIFSTLHNLINFMSAVTFIYFFINGSYDLTKFLTSCPFFFLIHVKIFAYQGQKGDYLIKSKKANLKNILPNNVKPQITYGGYILSSTIHMIYLIF